MTQEEKDFLKRTFGYEYKELTPPKKKYKLKPYKNWNGVNEPEVGSEQHNGQDESLYYFKMSYEMLYFKSDEVWTKF